MAKENYDEQRRLLNERLKAKPAQTPIQEVRPVEPTAPATPTRSPGTNAAGKPGEVHFNFWGSPELQKAAKRFALENDTTLKQVCNDALRAYLESKGVKV